MLLTIAFITIYYDKYLIVDRLSTFKNSGYRNVLFS